MVLTGKGSRSKAEKLRLYCLDASQTPAASYGITRECLGITASLSGRILCSLVCLFVVVSPEDVNLSCLPPRNAGMDCYQGGGIETAREGIDYWEKNLEIMTVRSISSFAIVFSVVETALMGWFAYFQYCRAEIGRRKPFRRRACK